MPPALLELLNGLGVANPAGGGLLAVILIFVVAVATTAVFMPGVRRYAIGVGAADQPNERRLNKEPLPNIGGLAVYGGVVAALVIATALRPIQIQNVQVQLLAILLGGTMLLLVGFIDDQFGLPPLFRLLVQLLAAGLLVVNGTRIQLPHGLVAPGGTANVLEVLVTLVWVVGITNAMNLMDGLDALVGGLGFIASFVLLAVSAQYEERAAATLLLAALAGGCLGFLRHNFNPSRIILGDGGAYFIGYSLAAVSILGTVKVAAAASLVSPLLFLLVPIVDTAQVIVRRLRRGVNPMSTPGKDHLHHQLLQTGLGPRRTVLVLWVAILAANVLGMVVQGVRPGVVVATVLAVVVLLAAVALPRVREANAARARAARERA